MNILTFDIEEWFHVLENESTDQQSKWSGFESRIQRNTETILQLLEKHNQIATFFCLGWIAKKYPEVVRSISDKGFELGTHSDIHQLVHHQTPQAFSEDLKRSIETIEDITGKKVRYYRAPGFSISEKSKWALEKLSEAGIEADSSIFPGKRAHGGFPSFRHGEPLIINYGGISLKEFPMNYYPIAGLKIFYSGGGYFRSAPYWLVRYMMEKSEYVMTYFHPRDFDPSQPMIADLSPVRRFKSYIGLKKAKIRLDRLLHDFRFIDMSIAIDTVDWNLVEQVKI